MNGEEEKFAGKGLRRRERALAGGAPIRSEEPERKKEEILS